MCPEFCQNTQISKKIMKFFSGSFLTNPVKESQQEITDLAYFEGLLNEIIQRKRRIKRAAPNEEKNRKVSLKAGLLESILGKNITPKSETSIRGETVGSLLATIPGILQVHEESYDTIGQQISSVGSGLIAAITSVHPVPEARLTSKNSPFARSWT